MTSTSLIAIVAVTLVLVLVLVRRLQSGGASGEGAGDNRVPEEGQGTDADVLRLLHAGKKIAAIKIYREIHGVGLREAKEAVERLG